MRLREIAPADAELLDTWRAEPGSMGEFNDFDVEMSSLAGALGGGRRFVEEEMGRLVVDRLEDGAVIGDMSWHPVRYGPDEGSKASTWGSRYTPTPVAGGTAWRRRLLADLLFDLFEVARVEASTDVENVPRQRALEKAGFTREGVLRQAQHHAAAHHDLVVYSHVRDDP